VLVDNQYDGYSASVMHVVLSPSSSSSSSIAACSLPLCAYIREVAPLGKTYDTATTASYFQSFAPPHRLPHPVLKRAL
jgi:hypothetical protein